MRGDFTRDTFQQREHFSRVLMQQGRVTLDADHNEQASILLTYLRTLARDLIGPYAAPYESGGFQLSYPSQNANGFIIGAGRYYVDGILVENDKDCAYGQQPDFPVASTDPLLQEIQTPTGKTYWIYLDVWERHITCIEDDSIREVALNGPDTCTRAKVVWQVKALPYTLREREGDKEVAAPSCTEPLQGLTAISSATMAAQVDPGKQSTDPCVLSPAAKYRGAENQLYRVEIHQSGAAGTATFKWSRDNGSVATAWLGWDGKSQLTVANARGFSSGNWVELSDSSNDLLGTPGTLVLVTKVDNGSLTLDPSTLPSAGISFSANLSKPKVRRWDQTQTGDIRLVSGAVPITEGTPAAPQWIDLEDGIQVQFTAGGQYRTGDYWEIPARVATGNIEWPQTKSAGGASAPAAIAPDGIRHYYAPLGFVSWTPGQGFSGRPCRCEFDPLSSCFVRQRQDVDVNPVG
jgi:hypothetical protein